MSDAGYIDPAKREDPSTYAPEHLRQLLVEDAVRSHATHLPWLVAAVQLIARAERKGLDDVFTSIVQEVETLAGRAELPLHSGVIL